MLPQRPGMSNATRNVFGALNNAAKLLANAVSGQLGIALKHHDAGSDALACASIAAQAILEGFAITDAILGPPSY